MPNRRKGLITVVFLAIGALLVAARAWVTRPVPSEGGAEPRLVEAASSFVRGEVELPEADVPEGPVPRTEEVPLDHARSDASVAGDQVSSLILERIEQIKSFKEEYERTNIPFYATQLMIHAVAAQADCAGLGHDVPAGEPGPSPRQGQFGFQVTGRERTRAYVLDLADYPIWAKLWEAGSTEIELSVDIREELEALVDDSLRMLGARE